MPRHGYLEGPPQALRPPGEQSVSTSTPSRSPIRSIRSCTEESSFEMRDDSRTPYPHAQIAAETNFTGMRVGYELEVQFTNVCRWIEVTLAPVADSTEGPVVMAFNAKRRLVDTVSPNEHASALQTLPDSLFPS